MQKLLPIFLLISVGLCANAHSAYYAQRTGPVAVGEVAPDLTLEDQSGQKVTLSDSRGKSPVVLVFYRGYW
jgi:cytochrome oxidase Cu insertion factor (SCO1/SenC/PrrC family)